MSQEILEPKGEPKVLNPRVVNRTVLQEAPQRPQSDIPDLAKRMAYDIVSGYVEHDRGRLDQSAEAFYRVYLNLFPQISQLRTHRAGELYVEALVKQDEIENTHDGNRIEIVKDRRWDDVKMLLLEFSRMLGLPESYAEKTMDFFRYHGVRDERYVNYCLESDGLFTTAVIGSDYWSKILGSLLLICTECHDKHDSTGLEQGLEFATKYFEIILRAMTVHLQGVAGPAQ